MENMRTVEEKLDHGAVEAARAQAFASLLAVVKDILKDGNVLQHRAALANLIVVTVAQLHRIFAMGTASLQARLLDAYEFSADRRFRGSLLKRIATFGVATNREADRAAAGALAEIENVGDALDRLRSRQLRDAVCGLLPLFEELAGSREEGVRAAMRVLKLLSPRDYQGLVDAATATTTDK